MFDVESFNEKNRNSPNTEKQGIIIKDLVKIYKRGIIDVIALRGLSCSFYEGEITVVMGPSGCGKSTLLNLIGGLDRANSGKILVNGENICLLPNKKLDEFRRKKIGYVFQFLNLIPEYSASENIGIPLILSKISEREKKSTISGLLSIVGLTDRENHKPDELSGGEQQKVAIAVALANNPDVILCDEPTGELDSESKGMILDLLTKIIKRYPKKILIIVSHDYEMRKIADKLYYIRDGKVSHEIYKEELQKQISVTPDFISKENSLNDLRELEHIIKKKIDQIKNN